METTIAERELRKTCPVIERECLVMSIPKPWETEELCARCKKEVEEREEAERQSDEE